MVTYDEAYSKVLNSTLNLGIEEVALTNSLGRVLAEDVLADRDFPPFDRVAMDGIAINFTAIESDFSTFKIDGIIGAGTPQQTLINQNNCFEIMTGAVLPDNTDTIIMYEKVTIKDGYATISEKPKKGQNVHKKGSDLKENSVVLKAGLIIDAAEIGVLASVGKSMVLVQKQPKIGLVATGNELVDVSKKPLPHQIRKSNMYSLEVALQKVNIKAEHLYFKDDKQSIADGLKEALVKYDVLLLSGGVSKGKYDFLPEVLQDCGVEKIFHRVFQKPGKPFWYGVHSNLNTCVFSFPGNPVSTFANYHAYFLPWLLKTYGILLEEKIVVLQDEVSISGDLTRFILVKTFWENGKLMAKLSKENGSGDLTSLALSDGFVRLKPKIDGYNIGDKVSFIGTRNYL